MSRTYINFCGQVNSGKTTTIDMVVNMLRKNLYVTPKKTVRYKSHVDYMVAMEITISGVKRCVALSTYGDDLPALKRNHEFFDKNFPDVMVTSSHCHDNHEHNLFIDNYVYCRIDASNTLNKEREDFDYIKVHSNRINGTKQEIEDKNKNKKYADKLYNLIIASLK